MLRARVHDQNAPGAAERQRPGDILQPKEMEDPLLSVASKGA